MPCACGALLAPPAVPEVAQPQGAALGSALLGLRFGVLWQTGSGRLRSEDTAEVGLAFRACTGMLKGILKGLLKGILEGIYKGLRFGLDFWGSGFRV